MGSQVINTILAQADLEGTRQLHRWVVSLPRCTILQYWYLPISSWHRASWEIPYNQLSQEERNQADFTNSSSQYSETTQTWTAATLQPIQGRPRRIKRKINPVSGQNFAIASYLSPGRFISHLKVKWRGLDLYKFMSNGYAFAGIWSNLEQSNRFGEEKIWRDLRQTDFWERPQTVKIFLAHVTIYQRELMQKKPLKPAKIGKIRYTRWPIHEYQSDL